MTLIILTWATLTAAALTITTLMMAAALLPLHATLTQQKPQPPNTPPPF